MVEHRERNGCVLKKQPQACFALRELPLACAEPVRHIVEVAREVRDLVSPVHDDRLPVVTGSQCAGRLLESVQLIDHDPLQKDARGREQAQEHQQMLSEIANEVFKQRSEC